MDGEGDFKSSFFLGQVGQFSLLLGKLASSYFSLGQVGQFSLLLGKLVSSHFFLWQVGQFLLLLGKLVSSHFSWASWSVSNTFFIKLISSSSSKTMHINSDLIIHSYQNFIIMPAPGRRARSECVAARGAQAPSPQNIRLTCNPSLARAMRKERSDSHGACQAGLSGRSDC